MQSAPAKRGRSRLRAGSRRRSLTLIVSAAALSAAIFLVGAQPGFATGSRERLRPPRGRAFVPRVGDWEGIAKGMHASFSLVRDPRGHRYGASGYAVANLLEQSFASCPVSPLSYGESVEGTSGYPLYVGRTGRFPFGFRTQGALLSAGRAKLSAKFDSNPPGSHEAGCRGTLHWTLRPAFRRRVEDGRWRFSYSDGTRQQVSIIAGGRLAPGIAIPQVAPTCNGTPSGGYLGTVDLFIPPNRNADQLIDRSSAGALRLKLRFRDATHAAGRFLASAPGCVDGVVSIGAVRVGR